MTGFRAELLEPSQLEEASSGVIGLLKGEKVTSFDAQAASSLSRLLGMGEPPVGGPLLCSWVQVPPAASYA